MDIMSRFPGWKYCCCMLWTLWYTLISFGPVAFSVCGVLLMVLRYNIPQTPSFHQQIDTSAFYVDYQATILTTFPSWTSTIAVSLTQTAIAALISLPIYRKLYPYETRQEGLTHEDIHLLAALPGDGGLAWTGKLLRSLVPCRSAKAPPALINGLGTVRVACS